MTRVSRRWWLVSLCLALPVAAGCGFFGPSAEEERRMQEEDRKCQTDKVQLEVAESATGGGSEARPGRRVTVHYTGWLFHPDKPANRGRKFDSSCFSGEYVTGIEAGYFERLQQLRSDDAKKTRRAS